MTTIKKKTPVRTTVRTTVRTKRNNQAPNLTNKTNKITPNQNTSSLQKNVSVDKQNKHNVTNKIECFDSNFLSNIIEYTYIFLLILVLIVCVSLLKVYLEYEN